MTIYSINIYISISKFVLFCTNGHCQDFVRKDRAYKKFAFKLTIFRESLSI
jgi:hypothetical protein